MQLRQVEDLDPAPPQANRPGRRQPAQGPVGRGAGDPGHGRQVVLTQGEDGVGAGVEGGVAFQ